MSHLRTDDDSDILCVFLKRRTTTPEGWSCAANVTAVANTAESMAYLADTHQGEGEVVDPGVVVVDKNEFHHQCSDPNTYVLANLANTSLPSVGR